MDSTPREHTEVALDPSVTRRAVPQRRQFVIYVGGESGNRIARCYDDQTSEHVFSSENAVSVRQALEDVTRALDRREGFR